MASQAAAASVSPALLLLSAALFLVPIVCVCERIEKYVYELVCVIGLGAGRSGGAKADECQVIHIMHIYVQQFPGLRAVH